MIGGLQIENFKCFRNSKMSFGDLTIISGANGVGKSTIIQSLLLLRETFVQFSMRTQSEGGEIISPYQMPVRLNDAFNLCLGNTKSITNVDLESDIVNFTVQSRNGRLYSFDYYADMENSRTSMQFMRSGLECLIEGPNNGISLFADEFHYLMAERVGPRDLYGVTDQRFPSTGFAGEYTAFAISQANKHQVSEVLCLNTSSTLFRLQLEAWLDQIVPGVQITTASYPEVNRVRIGISRKSSGTDWLLPANIGFGISYVLPVIVSGLLARPGSVFIVENPEAHLHPAAQSMIGMFLARVARSGVQVIVETHSENVVNGARLEALMNSGTEHAVKFLFLSMAERLSEPNVAEISMDGLGELSSWPLGFFDQQSRDLAQIFRARRELNKQNKS